MKMKLNDQIKSQLDAINGQLKVVEEHMAWMIKPESRFRIGQRVQWSRKGVAVGFPRRKKARRGIIRHIRGFSIVVKLDGLKQATSYHHSFFNPVTGPKLF